MSRPRCLSCGKGLSKYEHSTPSVWFVNQVWPNAKVTWNTPRDQWPSMTGDGQVPTRGRCGDNVFCSTNCGWAFAVRAVIAAGGPEEASRMMPEGWQLKNVAETATETQSKKSKARRDARKKHACMMPIGRARCARRAGHEGECMSKATMRNLTMTRRS